MTERPPDSRYTWYVVFDCFLVSTVNFVDRMVLNIFLPADIGRQVNDCSSPLVQLFQVLLAAELAREGDASVISSPANTARQ